jgi:hypothetical protein
MKPPSEVLSDLLAKGHDLTLEDMRDIEWQAAQLDYPDHARALDAVRLIITDPVYEGDIPPDYLD